MEATAVKAFIKAQTEMGRALKNATNPHLRSKYADLNSVLDAAMPALHGNGFGMMQPAGADERGLYVDTVLIHESGQQFSSRVYLVMGKQDMQALGSAQTYARRYGLLGMAGIAPEDDDGEATKTPPRQTDRKAAQSEPSGSSAQQTPFDEPSSAVIEAKAQLLAAQDLGALQSMWMGMPAELKREKALQDAKESRKTALQQKGAA